MQLQFYWDVLGIPRASGGPDCRLVANFLAVDIQGSAEWGRELLRTIDRIGAGELEGHEETGNAYTVLLEPDSVTVEPLWSEEEPCRVPLADFRDAVAGWVAFLDNSGP